MELIDQNVLKIQAMLKKLNPEEQVHTILYALNQTLAPKVNDLMNNEYKKNIEQGKKFQLVTDISQALIQFILR